MVSIHFPTWIPNTSIIITKYNNCQRIIIANNYHWISIFPDNNNCQVYSIHYCCLHNSIHRLAEMPTLTLISHRLSLDISSPPLIGLSSFSCWNMAILSSLHVQTQFMISSWLFIYLYIYIYIPLCPILYPYEIPMAQWHCLMPIQFAAVCSPLKHTW